MSLTKRDFYDQLIKNTGSEAIPPFAVVEIKTPGLEKFVDKEWFTVGKPSEGGKLYLLNGPYVVQPGGTGGAANPAKCAGAYALYDPAINPATNEVLTPKAGQWYLAKPDAEGENAEAPPASASFTVIGDKAGAAGSDPGYPNVSATKRVRVWMPSSGAGDASADGYGLLIADVGAATINLSASGGSPLNAEIVPGEGDNAVIPLEWSASGRLVAERDGENGPIVRLPVFNPVWRTEIKATNDANGCVIVRGRKETHKVGGTEKTVFVLTDIFYPVRFFRGVAQQSVSGGSFLASVVQVYRGLPLTGNVTLENPGAFTGPSGGYCLGMTLPNGNHVCLDLACNP